MPHVRQGLPEETSDDAVATSDFGVLELLWTLRLWHSLRRGGHICLPKPRCSCCSLVRKVPNWKLPDDLASCVEEHNMSIEQVPRQLPTVTQ